MIRPKYTRFAYATRIAILLVDLLFVFLSIAIAAILRHNFDIERAMPYLNTALFVVIPVRLISFRWFRTYAVIVRYAGASDIVQVFAAVTGGSIFLIGLSVVLRSYDIEVPLSILVIDYFLLLSFMSGVRIMMPILFFFISRNQSLETNVIIIGAGQLGAITRNVIRQDRKANYNIVGIIDDNLDLNGKYLDGIPVYLPNSLAKLMGDEKIEKAVFAIQNISIVRKNELVDLCLNNDIKVLQVPFRSRWIDTEFKLDQIKEIDIEDLLNRPVIDLNKEHLESQIQGKTIMITGGAGSIGSELVRQIIKYRPCHIVVVDQAETPLVNISLECIEDHDFSNMTSVIADVTDLQRMEHIFKQYRPHIVFHAAAYKHVPIMEAFPREAINVNVKGTTIVANLSNKYEIDKFVMISTDKAVNPTNVMGASKRIAEIYIQSLDKKSKTQYITTRFGNVLGSNGSVVPRFRKQLSRGGPITVTHPEITRYFMTIPEASLLVLEAGVLGGGGEIFLFDMGHSVKILDLAIKMIQLSGLTPYKDIDIVFSGLRAGEKLYEELLSNKENSLPTHHPKITKAKVRDYDFDLIKGSILELIHAIDHNDDIFLVKKMKELVPEYISRNSIFNQID